jgi:hypothetical protein
VGLVLVARRISNHHGNVEDVPANTKKLKSIRNSIEKIENSNLCVIVVLMAESRIFGIFPKSNQVLVPTHKFILLSYSAVVQIYKTFRYL